MKAQSAFALLMFVILVALLAHIFACERNDGAGPAVLGGAKPRGREDITQFIVPRA